MAVDMYSQSSSPSTSPRISFSLDLHHANPDANEKNISESPPLLDMGAADFNFCATGDGKTFREELSSADELFSDGLIMPKQLEERFFSTLSKQSSLSKAKVMSSLPPLPIQTCANPHGSEQEIPKDIGISSDPKAQSKSFWRINRSSSLHCENGHKKNSFWSSLPLLLRSNSTGSVTNSKLSSKDNQKQSFQKQQKQQFGSSSSFCSSQRPPLKKKNGVNYGNVVRISTPVLSAPPPIISTNLFGFGALFSNGKDKKTKK